MLFSYYSAFSKFEGKGWYKQRQQATKTKMVRSTHRNRKSNYFNSTILVEKSVPDSKLRSKMEYTIDEIRTIISHEVGPCYGK